jgi:hypothetical protein
LRFLSAKGLSIPTLVDEKAWMLLNVRLFGDKRIGKSFSFEELRLSSSFSNGLRPSKFEYPCSHAIGLHIKPRHDS